jgi:hypothetical protein
MNQDKHLFQFSGQKIADAALEEAHYHWKRVTFWATEQEAAIVKAKGMSAIVRVVEQSITGGRRVQVIAEIADVLVVNQRLMECGAKIQEHQKAADEFDLKGKTYMTQPTRMYELDPSDVHYFRLAGGARPE